MPFKAPGRIILSVSAAETVRQPGLSSSCGHNSGLPYVELILRIRVMCYRVVHVYANAIAFKSHGSAACAWGAFHVAVLAANTLFQLDTPNLSVGAGWRC